ncbi:MAG: hypothetical protein AUK55_12480 [Syntrophobacteraceae bacterium CG2_30_61_12]|nr:MAG: hypothetical protein AUK55_12480 [Syntrophobacteraceae bacterium CG2_30_61_12]
MTGARMIQLKLPWACALFAALAILRPVPAAAGQMPILPGAVRCPAKIEWHLDPSVQIIRFTCADATERGRALINYELEMCNTGKSPRCYRVQIVNQGEAATAEFYPESGGPPAIEPGQVVKARYTSPVRRAPVEELIIYIRSACP